MLLLYTDHITPRLEWILDVFLNRVIGIQFELTDDANKFSSSLESKLCYSKKPIGESIHIIPHSLLLEKSIIPQKTNVQIHNGYSFFETNDEFLQFDFLAASFYLVSRYEEYLPHKKDKHGRYLFKNSLSFKHGFIDQPLVNQWGVLVTKKLQSLFPKMIFRKKEFQILPTMDIDVAYAYKGRSMLRNMRSLAKDIIIRNKERIIERKNVKRGTTDPFDNYDDYEQLLKKHKLTGIYFFLLGDYGTYDKNLHHTNQDLIKLIKKYTTNTGSHLSYASHQSIEKMKIEKRRLENIVGSSVDRNRFHYLKFSIPESYQRLISLGYTEDYSMVYPEVPGFRASICTPYPFYDLENESTTQLMIYPTTIMDATCQDYLKQSPTQALKTIKHLIDTIKAVNGLFVTLWHNDALSEIGQWKDWKDVLEKSLDYACLKKDNN